MLEKAFDADVLYNRIVRHYMNKKGYGKERANVIARSVVAREAQKRTCSCGHMMHDHVRNSGTCLSSGCGCGRFAGPGPLPAGGP
ncbi:MAG: hypothetical protein MPJ05_03975 [Nitrosopumilus sp.]|nr:hypothetical protein [Nitrosopumilus sp.]MDA7944821.1 hypothetical protein [Nitrosopumilus sp.]MDA7952965.1 hypothetical protein [Nitrosopumilus sp.]MDA7955139.1 hypothetical protein [Nitrosopumilus sp.]MDA7960065.1 hypothetical protein [Nitrosopumilus sp.]